jgi:tRNA(Ile)-lysidine synthase
MLHLAVAHHAKDQRETVALRRAGGSGPRGLAGMPEVRELDHVRIIRPLLEIEPERLRTVLEARQLCWLADPSNTDRRFWRARHRAATSAAPLADAPPPDAPRAEATRAARRAIDRRIAAFLARHARLSPLGFITINAAPLLDLADDVLAHVLGRVIATVGGRTWPPAGAKLARLAAWLRGGDGSGSALGGVLLARKRRDVLFVREARAVAAPTVLPPDGMVWDERFRIAGVDLDDWLEIAAAGPGWRPRLRARSPGWPGAGFGSAVPATVLATMPLIRSDAGPVALGPWPLADTEGAPRVRFRPRVRLADAAFCQSSMALVVSPR